MLSVHTRDDLVKADDDFPAPYELNLVKQSGGTSLLALHLKVFDQALRIPVQEFITREQLSLEDVFLSDGCIEYVICSSDLARRMNALDLVLFSMTVSRTCA